MAKFEGARHFGNSATHFVCISMAPDVCKNADGTPVPYSIVGFFDDSANASPNVNFRGKPAMTMAGNISTIKGDEPGVGGGVVSGVNLGSCVPITHSSTVRVNRKHVLYETGTRMWMNCASPKASIGNTVGKVVYVGAKGQAAAAGGAVVSADPPVQPEGFVEGGCLKGAALPGAVQPGMGIVDLAQKAYQLTQVNWKDPLSAIGAVVGLGDPAGASALSQAVGLARQAHAFTQNPAGALLGLASGLAGAGPLGAAAQQISGLRSPAPTVSPLAQPIVATPAAPSAGWPSSLGGGLLDAVGKLWTLPNTLLGTAYLGVGHLYGLATGGSPDVAIGNNALVFLNNPFVRDRTAVTLGNTIGFGAGVNPDDYRAYGDPTVQWGLHEEAHTYQAQVLGPLYLPAWLLSGGLSGPQGNPMEAAAQEYGRGSGSWWPTQWSP